MEQENKPRWVPVQYKEVQPIDFRDSGYGPRGYKLENKEKLIIAAQEGKQAEMMTDEQEIQGKQIQIATSSSGKKSGRSWKAPAKRASSVVMKQNSKDWQTKMMEKRVRSDLLEKKREAVQLFKDRAADKRRALRVSKERKEANRKKSTVFQKITNSTKLKKMMKSRKLRQQIMSLELN
eukprot:TRINITY_DN4555_c0_g1_i1.p2 TRINITY_DN4555_c0_g1~~TRINITY_DN4555_c0_g1_i1.p2  ORF type:complete len:198 (-),score=32.02 TRINITY_DN4555_c0_g1_i1:167-703(-)